MNLRPANWHICALLSSYFVLVSFKLPDFYAKKKKPTDSSLDLSAFVIEINGVRTLLHQGQIKSYLEGDVIVVHDAVLKDESKKAEEVNVVGFRHPKIVGGRNDLGFEIKTLTDLKPGTWGVDADKTTTVIAAATKEILHGYAFLKKTPPELRYVDIKINDHVKVMREGEVLEVNDSDLFKVSRVVTNLKNQSGLTFQLVDLGKRVKLAGEAERVSYEIRFKHNKKIFAKIPVQVKKEPSGVSTK